MLFQTPPINQAQQIIISITEKKEEPKEPTLEEKIASNYYTCTNLQWIRADNATCLDKPIAIAETPATSPQDTSQAPSGSPAVYSGNLYAPGNCTYYAKQMRPDMPNNLGNADTWAINAAAQGLRVSYAPQVGAVAVALSYTHVAIVTAVHGKTIEISEMNYKGLWIVSIRTAPISEFTYIL